MPVPVWPFPVKDVQAQGRRIDQGWDLQYQGTTPVPVLAVLPGLLQNAGPDPAGFGPGYPLLMVNPPDALGYPAIYYGHTFTDMSKVGRRVRQGEAIGMTGGLHSGGNAYPDPNWLEIGFWRNGPAAGGQPGASAAGQQMHDWLLHAPSGRVRGRIGALRQGLGSSAAPGSGRAAAGRLALVLAVTAGVVMLAAVAVVFVTSGAGLAAAAAVTGRKTRADF